MLALGLMLTGCAGGDAQAEPAPTVTVTETVTATPEPEEVAEDVEADTETDSDEESVDESVAAEDLFNERGNIPMPENFGRIRNTVTDEVAVYWEASDVRDSVDCTGPYPEPASGTLLAIDFDVEVFDEADSLIPEGFYMFADDFYVVDGDGAVSSENLNSLAAFSCLPESDVLPDRGLRGGNTATGTLVFESPLESGFLVYEDFHTGVHYEWEF